MNLIGNEKDLPKQIPAGSQEVADQVELILQSSAFRSSPALRQLLKFLTEKFQIGEADQLKEYSVGMDALGKPESFDSRRDSSVRLQMRRLRQKLAEYYGAEGEDDPYVIDVPKGGFTITCTERAPSEPASSETALSARPLREALRGWTLLMWILKVLEVFLMVLAFVLSVVAATEVWRETFH